MVLICLVLLASATTSDEVANATTTTAIPPVRYYGDSHPFELTYSPARVFRGITENVQLRCSRNAAAATSVAQLVWMRLLTYTPDDGWSVLAEQVDGRSEPDTYGEVTSSARMAPVEDSYLSVVWTNPRDRVIASYKCLTLGLDQSLAFVVDETPIVEIKAKKISEVALLDIILNTGESIKHRAINNSKEISNTAHTLEVYASSSEQHFQATNDRLDQANLTVESMMSDFLYLPAGEVWPAGNYALLKPESGCPADLAFYEGDTGYFRLHTESSTMLPDNGFSENSHLSQPVLTSYSVNTFMTFRFCVANGVYNSGVWPNGRYCIHKKGGCPGGFNSGYISFKTEAWGNLDSFGGNTPEGGPTRMHFCCMTTGDPTAAIVLPTAHPFYLYQYDGRCQKVKGMKAREEYVQVHTETGSSGTSYHPYLPTVSAGHLVRLELCYYTKQ